MKLKNYIFMLNRKQMKKNILKENMKRFGTKNLKENIKSNSEFNDVVKLILRGASVGDNMTDDIVDELGDFYDDVYNSGDSNLIRLYDQLRNTADNEADRQSRAASKLLNYLDGDKISEQMSVPADKIVKISGSEPYYTVIYNDKGKNIQINFTGYEVEDKLDNYSVAMTVTGTDKTGQRWSVEAEAVGTGGGDYDWEFDWHTIERM